MITLIQHGEYSYDLLDLDDDEWSKWIEKTDFDDSDEPKDYIDYLYQVYQEWCQEPRPRHNSRSFTQWLRDRGAKEVGHETLTEY
jgi:hypothetical protein